MGFVWATMKILMITLTTPNLDSVHATQDYEAAYMTLTNQTKPVSCHWISNKTKLTFMLSGDSSVRVILLIRLVSLDTISFRCSLDVSTLVFPGACDLKSCSQSWRNTYTATWNKEHFKRSFESPEIRILAIYEGLSYNLEDLSIIC